jgi:hypothetical protein
MKNDFIFKNYFTSRDTKIDSKKHLLLSLKVI